jgi:glycosyltransferase involved in cell wall biosynthesis
VTLKILITNADLSDYAGTQIVVRDIAGELARQGHQPIVYSPRLGAVADEIRESGIAVTDRLATLDFVPDIIHGQHHQTLDALLHFSAVPAIHVCHGSRDPAEAPFYFPRILRYVAVDQPCRKRIESTPGIPTERIQTIHNAVDLKRFKPRPPLPARPRRALVFSNHAARSTHLPAVQKACRQSKLELDVIGSGYGNTVTNPENVLPRYDIIFAKARCALEALAVGNAVVLCDHVGLGEMVSSENLDALRPMNFGAGLLVRPLSAELIRREIDKYNPLDAAAVSQRVRNQAGLEETTRCWIKLYSDVIEEFAHSPRNCTEEVHALADYLRQWNYWDRLEWERDQLKKLGSVPVVGGALLSAARRFLRKWTSGWGIG